MRIYTGFWGNNTMSGIIYLIHSDGKLVPMTEQPYDTEELLQHLLASHPDLLAGEQVDSVAPRQWLFVAREVVIPTELNTPGRLSLDHLLLDQDAIPTLVEVKRSSDTRIRREVVGQMLDYAANAVVYLPQEKIRSLFETTCEMQNHDPHERLAAFLGLEADIEDFWHQVQTNLQAGKIRLLFVADAIPAELRRIVEFLNTQMNPAQVLAIEIKQYVGSNVRTLVPRVIGQTATTLQQKGGTRTPDRQWDESSLLQDLAQRAGNDVVRVAQDILAWAKTHSSRVWWGKGKTYGSFVPTLTHNKENYPLFAFFGSGTIETYFYWHAYKPPFDNELKRLELRDRLNTIPGIAIPRDGINRRPSFPAKVLTEKTALQQFLEIYMWFIQETRAI